MKAISTIVITSLVILTAVAHADEKKFAGKYKSRPLNEIEEITTYGILMPQEKRGLEIIVRNGGILKISKEVLAMSGITIGEAITILSQPGGGLQCITSSLYSQDCSDIQIGVFRMQ